MTSAVLLVLVSGGAAVGIWQALGTSTHSSPGEARAIRAALARMVDEATELARLTGPDLQEVRQAPRGETAWRESVSKRIAVLQKRVEDVNSQPGARLLSQRATFVFRRAAGRLDKFRAVVRRRVTTIEQSACAIAREGARQIAALDGNLPDRCVGVGSSNCSEVVRAYMTRLGVRSDVCPQ